MVEPVTRAHEDGPAPDSSLSTEGTLRRAGATRRGSSFRDERKHREPQDREQGETNLHGRRGASRRGGAKPRGRNAGRTGCPSPKGDAATRTPGDGLFDSERWRGVLWTTPGEDFRLDQAGTHGSGRDGKVGVKVRRVARAHFRVTPHPGRRDLEDPALIPPKVEEGSGEANRRGSDRGSPPVEGPRATPPEVIREGGGRRETVRPRASETSNGEGVARHVRGPSVRGVDRAERPASTLKTRRTHIPARGPSGSLTDPGANL